MGSNPISSAKMKLLVTPKMLRRAVDLKMHLIVMMNPTDFLYLTTQDDATMNQVARLARPLSDYNQFAEEQTCVVMPFLYIDKQGKVTGHEGRHRAAALIESGTHELSVSIRLDEDLDATSEYLPYVLHGEFGRGVISTAQFKIVNDGWQDIKDSW